jgi:hypothetical protein
MRPRGGQITRNMNLDVLGLAGFRIENIEAAELLVDEGVGTGRHRFEVQSLVVKDLLHFLRFGVVGEDRDRTFTVGKEIDRVSHPDRV